MCPASVATAPTSAWRTALASNVIEGRTLPKRLYYEAGSKSWIYGATYGAGNVAYDTAAFLFTNPK